VLTAAACWLGFCTMMMLFYSIIFGIGRFRSHVGPAVFAVATLIIIALFVLFLVRIIGNTANKRRRIGIMIIGYFCLVVCFGGIYYGLYRRDPMNFQFTSISSIVRTEEVFEDYYRKLRDVQYKLYLLAVVEANPESGLSAVRNARKWVNIDDNIKMQYWIHVAEFGSIIPFFTIYDGDIKVEFFSLDVLDGSLELVLSLSMAKSIDDFKTKLGRLIEYYKRERKELCGHIARAVKADAPWDFIDFVYFSTVTMTTLGYGDVVPNSRVARLCVAAQTLFGISYLGFALFFLWPKEAM